MAEFDALFTTVEQYDEITIEQLQVRLFSWVWIPSLVGCRRWFRVAVWRVVGVPPYPCATSTATSLLPFSHISLPSSFPPPSPLTNTPSFF
jgi:hypothetical protein